MHSFIRSFIHLIMSISIALLQVTIDPCAGRAAANLLAPPPTFVDRRADAAADGIFAGYLLCCNFRSMAKKGHQKILRIGRNFFGTLLKKFLGRQRRAAADFNDVGAGLYRSLLRSAPGTSTAIKESF